MKKICCIILFTSWLNIFSNPSGENVISGDVSITRSDDNLLIKQTTDKAVVNWIDFSIKKNETTNVIMPSASSTIVNKVIGNIPSFLNGNLTSNGKVFLINDRGIQIGPSGRVKSASFIASTLDIKDIEFSKDGEVHFLGGSTNSIVNYGKIETTGDVYLIAKNIENYGEIRANKKAGLIGANEAYLYSKKNQIVVKLNENDSLVTNEGLVEACQVEVKASCGNISTLAINQSGIISANSFEDLDGEIVLIAEKGNVEIKGQITSPGGEVNILGDNIALLENAVIDVSSINNAGKILIGGDYKGKNPDIKNAKNVFVDSDVIIKANSTVDGDGGRVILWADDGMAYKGSIFAEGGEYGGDGGFVEVSSHGCFFVPGFVSTRAIRGNKGTLLYDPADVTITTSDTNFTYAGGVYTFTGTPATIDVTTLVANLGLTPGVGTNVIIDTSEGSIVGGSGDITVSTGFTWSGQTTLTLLADRTININRAITNDNPTAGSWDAMVFTARGTASGSAYRGVHVLNDLTTDTGGIKLNGTGGDTDTNNRGVNIQGIITTTSGDIEIIGQGGAGTSSNWGVSVILGRVVSTSGNISITGTGGNGSSSSNYGVFLSSTNPGSNGYIHTTSGDIVINGTGGNGTSSNHGFIISNGGEIKSSGPGNISIIGTGGDGSGSSNIGSYLSSGTIVSEGIGTIILNGYGGKGGGGDTALWS